MAKKALLIGINYNNTEEQLNGCINDVRNIQNLLANQFGYSNIRVLTDVDISPNKANIEAGIQWLLQGARKGDNLYLHFSGHGHYVRDTNGDETDRRDEVLVPIDFKKAGFITDDWLFINLISKIPAGVNFWSTIDSCHSGTVLDLKYNFQSIARYKSSKIPKNINYVASDWTDAFRASLQNSKEVIGPKICLFSGALDTQYANDAFLQNQSQGAFTCCFIETITANANKPLTLRNMLKELNVRLRIKGFTTQNSQLSINLASDIGRTFSL